MWFGARRLEWKTKFGTVDQTGLVEKSCRMTRGNAKFATVNQSGAVQGGRRKDNNDFSVQKVRRIRTQEPTPGAVAKRGVDHADCLSNNNDSILMNVEGPSLSMDMEHPGQPPQAMVQAVKPYDEVT
jgi:hypothetical protein